MNIEEKWSLLSETSSVYVQPQTNIAQLSPAQPLSLEVILVTVSSLLIWSGFILAVWPLIS